MTSTHSRLRPTPAEPADPAASGPVRTWRRPGTEATTHAAAELGVLCVGLGTAVGFSRLFLGWAWLPTLACAVVASWAIAVATRRLGIGVIRSTALTAVLGIFALAWRFAPGTTLVGIPTPDTATALGDVLHGSFGGFRTLVAPVAATDGFLVVIAAAMWAFTSFADTAAFRYRGPVQAVIPYTSAFVAAGILAREPARAASAAAFLVGLAVYGVTQRVMRVGERRWVGGDRGRGTRSVAAAAAAIAAVALCVGVAVGPWLPGDASPVVDLKELGRGGGTRTVVSPFVGVRNLLEAQSDSEMFSVRSTTADYWRLTALERYDASRDIWVSSASYADVDGSRLGGPPGRAPTRDSAQDVTVAGLAGPWIPAAYAPTSIDISTDVGFDESSSSVIVRGSDLAAGTRYRVRSAVPTLSRLDLTGARVPTRGTTDALDLAGVSRVVGETARQVAGDQPTPYLQALALQDWFRDTFTYSTDVDYRNEPDPVAAFLIARQGFCQQFSSTFALMARTLGLPSRVAVGFTQGDLVPGDAGPSFVVRGRHAHAWPEVRFDGIGWVAFEPTPGRGNPTTSTYTGAPAGQADPPPAQAPTTIAPATTAPSGPDPSVATTAPPPTTTTATTTPARPAGGSGGAEESDRWWPVAAVVLTVAALGGWLLASRRRRNDESSVADTDARVAAAWRRATEDLSTVDLAPASSETPGELARRVASAPVWTELDGSGTESATPAGVRIGTAMSTLARIETARRYAPGLPDESSVRAADEATSEVRSTVRSTASQRRRRGRQPVR